MIAFSKHIYSLFERDRESKQGRGRERERGRKRIPSRLHAVSTETDAGLRLTHHEVMTSAETKSRMPNRLSHAGPPGIALTRWEGGREGERDGVG